MATTTPRICKQWTVADFSGLSSLNISEAAVPEIGETEVLVKIQGASLNPRDIVIADGQYPWATKRNVVPGSDGAGTVLAIGKRVTRFQPGDKVITMLNQKHIAGPVTHDMLSDSLGATVDGTLRTAGAFDENGLVKMPENLTFAEAATLSCAGVTAWNALFGLEGRKLTAGQCLLTIGTGGVSLFALQFAKAIGARVIATTSSEDKARLLEEYGADHIINYNETPDWGQKAKELTGGIGVDHVVEVAGPSTLAQSAAAVRLEGLIAVVGFIGGESTAKMPSLLDTWINNFTARGLWVGSRMQMEEMCRAIEANPKTLRPVMSPKTFTFEQVKEAYEYLAAGKHQGKVGIEFA